jgi:MJ0570-related uncharacterized domain
MKVGILYSGGKDSTFSLYKVFDIHKIECLITVEPSTNESMLFHFPNIWVTKYQAKILDLPQIYQVQKSNEMDSLTLAIKRAIKEYGIEGVVTGGIKSKFQKDRFQKIFDSVGVIGISPLWGIDEISYLRTLVHSGFRFILTKVSALGLGKEWLGKTFDDRMIEHLIESSNRYGFNPSLEGGEGETLVLDMPYFKRELIINSYDVFWYGDWGYLKVNSVTDKEK